VYDSAVAPGSRDAELAQAGDYVEQEYFLSGSANIYRYAEGGGIEVATPNVPFKTRMLVVRPRDPARFSGNVIYGPLHPARGNGHWQSVRDYAMREGHIYVGLFIGTDERSRAGTVQAGQPADGWTLTLASAPERYAALVWPRDDGIRWDVFGQAAQLLRGDDADNPLRGLPVERMYAMGWSFTGSFLRTYINEGFHDRYRLAGGAPAIDGYLLGISQHHFSSGYIQLNADTPILPGDDPRRLPRAIDVPVIELMTETEAITRVGEMIPQGDARAGGRRIYETPGVTHGDGLRDTVPPSECPYPVSDVPFRYLAWGALENLDAWSRADTPPPRQASNMNIVSGRAARDVNGNAAGGVQPAEVAVPLARYGETGDARCASRAAHYLEMRRVPLSREQLTQLYPGGAADYLRRYEAHLDQQIAQRFILAEDKPALMAHAREAAAVAFR